MEFLHSLQQSKETLHVIGGTGVILSLILSLIVGIHYFSELNEFQVLGVTLHDRIRLPIRDIYPKQLGGCPTLSNAEVIYRYPGTMSKCSCDNLGVTEGLCSQDSRCQSIQGLPGNDFHIWEGRQFCLYYYESKDFTIKQQIGCENPCGKFCMADEVPCPIKSISFAKNFEKPATNVSTEVIRFNTSDLFVVHRVNEDDDASIDFINKVRIGFNGPPCFMDNLQRSWFDKEVYFQEQKYGCNSFEYPGVSGTFSDKSVTIDQWDGLSFFNDNLKSWEMEELKNYYGSPELEELKAQTIYLSFSTQIPIREATECWGLAFEDLNILAEGILPEERTLNVIWILLIITIYLFLISVVFSRTVIKQMKALHSLVAPFVFLLVLAVNFYFTCSLIKETYDDSSLSSKSQEVLHEIIKNDCLQEASLNQAAEFLIDGLEILSENRFPVYLALGILNSISCLSVLSGFIGYVYLCLTEAKKQSSEILLTKIVL